MRIAIGADHAGFALKEALVKHLVDRGHDVDDLGTDSEEPVDYPPLCAAVARRVVGGDADLLAMGGRIVAAGLAVEIVNLWLATEFEGGRHERRVAQIAAIEADERGASG